MSEVKQIEVSLIDPTSPVNVRRQGVEQNVDRIKMSIEQHGYMQEYAIVVRSHPTPNAEYDYQHVSGQCRLKACIELGLKEIPAFIMELTDEQAIQRSWLENESHEALAFSDRAYWTERIYKAFTTPEYSGRDALELAARYLGVTRQTVMRYYSLAELPEDLMPLVDGGTLPVKTANTIVQQTYDRMHREQSQQKMRDRVSWYLGLDREGRRHAIGALEEAGHKNSIADLNKYVTKQIDESSREIRITIPSKLSAELANWGRSRGLIDLPTISSHIITEFMRREAK